MFNKGEGRTHGVLDWGVYPYVTWLIFFLFGPLVFVVLLSFQEKGLWGGVSWVWSFSSYVRTIDPLYLSVLWNSVKLAGFTTVTCLILGFPMAWYMTTLARQYRVLALIVVLMPFVSNFVVRTYALKFLIGVEGPLNRSLTQMGLIDSPIFLRDVRAAVFFGMVTNYLPFAVLPLYVALERFDFNLIESAKDLGANSFQIVYRIVIPLIRTAIMTAVTLVFVPALGELLIPDLLGGGKTMYVGNLLAEQFLKSRDWPFGAALCVLMMCLVGAFSVLVKKGEKH